MVWGDRLAAYSVSLRYKVVILLGRASMSGTTVPALLPRAPFRGISPRAVIRFGCWDQL